MSDTVRVITTCTSRKVAGEADGASDVLPGFDDPERTLPAELLYAGEQHRRLMAGVTELRSCQTVQVWVISARAGLVAGDQRLAPYDESFAGMSTEQVRERADRLEIASALRRLVATRSSLTILLAGNEYFDAARLDEEACWASPTIALVSPSRAERLPTHPNLHTIPVGQALARAWSLPLTLLKGEIVRRLLISAAESRGSHGRISAPGDLLDAVLSQARQPILC